MLRALWVVLKQIALLLRKRRSPKRKSYFSKEYLQYIRSPEWKQKREQVFARYGRKCCRCSATRNLQVDHKRYPPRGAAIEAFRRQGLEDFQVLCVSCHDQKTRSDRAVRRRSRRR